MSLNVLLKNVTVLDSESTYANKVVDIFIEDGVISKIGNVILEELNGKSIQILEVINAYVSVGWLDMRTSLCDPGFEHKETLKTGSNAAMSGGFTGIVCMPDTQPIIQNKDTIAYIKSFSKNSLVDIFPMAAATHNMTGNGLSEMLELHHAGAVAFIDGNLPIENPKILIMALQYLQLVDGMLVQNPEDKNLTQYGQMNEGQNSTYLGLKGIPNLAEELIISRDLDILKYTGGKIHFSKISTKLSVGLIRNAKLNGLNVSCDVAVPNLIFDDSFLKDFNSNFKLKPPLRTKEDIASLWEGLKDGTIDVIVTDHCPQDEESKNMEFDMAEFGSVGLETAFPALLSAMPVDMRIEFLVNKFSKAPRQLLKLPQPTIEEGQTANISVFSTDMCWNYNQTSIHSKSKNSPFINKNLVGRAIAVINNNKIFIN